MADKAEQLREDHRRPLPELGGGMNLADRTRDVPHSIEAEQSVLGGLILAPESITKVADWLVEGDFYRKDHRLIFRAIQRVWTEGVTPDAVTLGEWLQQQGVAN